MLCRIESPVCSLRLRARAAYLLATKPSSVRLRHSQAFVRRKTQVPPSPAFVRQGTRDSCSRGSCTTTDFGMLCTTCGEDDLADAVEHGCSADGGYDIEEVFDADERQSIEIVLSSLLACVSDNFWALCESIFSVLCVQ